jgi:hypothetical protein
MLKNHILLWILSLSLSIFSCTSEKPAGTTTAETAAKPIQLSGIYPHLAYYNKEGECGTGAVVPWADRLWVITYGPHLPYGSSDKLYEITPDLQQIVRSESTGGTPANRLIHQETKQLFIGPYVIDKERSVRVIPYKEAPGRYTGLARHLTDPAGKVYLATMEEGFYEVDAQTLKTTMIYEDGNVKQPKGEDISTNQHGSLLPGAHGKGVYSGQGVMVYSNNGEASPEALRQFDIEAGGLAEWNGKEWKVVRRNQFVEVTGPGGIYGNPNPETDPIWATGWDHKSVLLGVRDSGKWSFFRLPKASHSYDGAHGWNTEWPRIRDVGTPGKPDYLMTMHGLFWNFPGTFSSANTAGIRPRSAYLKVIGDFARWKDELVFGCDDSAQKEFLNKRKVKGGIEGPGQSNSNLWFISTTLPSELGPATASGAVWLKEQVTKGQPSEPFLFDGWPQRSAWFRNDGKQAVTLTFETDKDGKGTFTPLRTVKINAGSTAEVAFTSTETGEWIRAVTDVPTVATLHFSYTSTDSRKAVADNMFKGLALVTDSKVTGGLLYGLGDDRRALGIAVTAFDGTTPSAAGYYELDAALKLTPKADAQTREFIQNKYAIPKEVIGIEESSVLIVDDLGRRWRLPLGHEAFAGLTQAGALRIAREVATERDLLNCMGTFYELPAENADGFAKIRPVASHNFRIHDYASYRGLLIMTGISPQAGQDNPHVIISADGKAAVWAGVIDDLWKLGKPTGKGGPWKNTRVKANVPSDPYLIGFYDKRSLMLSHQSEEPVTFSIEAEPVGHGPWMSYKTILVEPGKTVEYTFPDTFQARWIRFSTDKATTATAWLIYQ